MRSSRNMRLVTSDLRKLQKTMSDKIDKDVESLKQLMQLPDFDVFQFFQNVAKSAKPEQLLQKISEQKKIDFFSRNYVSFIETQQALAKLKLPVLEQIPKAKKFHFQEPKKQNNEQKFQESSVIEIVDAFSVSVLQKNNEESIRILQLIKQMKGHQKYKQYFNIFTIQELFRQSYQTFLENCQDRHILIEMGESSIAMKKHLKESNNNFIQRIRTDLYIDNSAQAIKKIMYSLVAFIQKTLKQINSQYSEKIIDHNQVSVILAKWLSDVSQEFYQNMESSIYEKEQVSDVLEALDVIIQTSSDFQSKGVNLSKDFRTLISNDLPAHMNKIVEVVVEAFEDILAGDNQLYQFKYFDGLSSFSFLDEILVTVGQRDYGKKCCSKKGILLINSFVIILQPLCDEKWQFLHASIIQNLLQKVSTTILYSNWQYWDYFQLFHFFQRLKNGKVKHKKLFHMENIPTNTKQQLTHINKLSIQCWQAFQDRITKQFWQDVLIKIPQMLYQIKPYLQAKSKSSNLKPTIFGMDLFFKFQDFLKILEFRLQRPQFQHLLLRFFHYVLYVMEYVLYWQYHHRGQKQKVFLLYKVSDKILKKAKIFAIDEIQTIKQHKNIMIIAKTTCYGIQNLALDMYYFTQALKDQTNYNKLNCDNFTTKLSEIQAKQHKTQPTNINRQKYSTSLDKFLKILKDEPQKIKQYIESKRKPNKK